MSEIYEENLAAAEAASKEQTEAAVPANQGANEPEAPPAPEEHAEGEGEGQTPHGVQKRLDKITWEREEARREARATRELLDRALALIPQAKPEPQPQAPDPLTPPDPNKYPAGRYDPDYMEALTEHKVAVRFAQQDQQAKQRTEQAAHEKRATEIATLESEFEKSTPNYRTALQAFVDSGAIRNPGVTEAMFTSDHAPAISHYLGTHPDEAAALVSMSPIASARKIGQIEARIEKATPTDSEGAPVSKAAPPPTHIKGATGANMKQFKTAIEAGRAGDFDTFCKLREAEERKLRFG